MTYTIREVSRRTGLPASTLRYYENEHLLSPVQRNSANRRVYDEHDMDWLSVITCLKNTGMPIQEIKRFVSLCTQGDQTLTERYALLLAHRTATQARIAQLQQELGHIEAKVAYYAKACDAARAGEAVPPGCGSAPTATGSAVGR